MIKSKFMVTPNCLLYTMWVTQTPNWQLPIWRPGPFPAIIMGPSLPYISMFPLLHSWICVVSNCTVYWKALHVMKTKTTLYFYPSALKFQTLDESFGRLLSIPTDQMHICSSFCDSGVQGIPWKAVQGTSWNLQHLTLTLIDSAQSPHPPFPPFIIHSFQGEWEITFRNRTQRFGKVFHWQRNLWSYLLD